MAARSEAAGKNDEGSRLEADIEQLKADLKRLNETLVGLGREKLDFLQSEGTARVETLRKELDALAESVKGHGRDQLGNLERQVRDRPLLTLLAAFGVGMVISRLLDRR